MHEWFDSPAVWYAIGFAGQLLFSSRFFVQWILSERARRVVIPSSFWFLSMGGGIALLVYAIHRQDPVFALGQAGGLVVYARNMHLSRHGKNATT